MKSIIVALVSLVVCSSVFAKDGYRFYSCSIDKEVAADAGLTSNVFKIYPKGVLGKTIKFNDDRLAKAEIYEHQYFIVNNDQLDQYVSDANGTRVELTILDGKLENLKRKAKGSLFLFAEVYNKADSTYKTITLDGADIVCARVK